MTAVAIQHEPQGQVIQAGASLMDVISRAAADPNTDVDKLERLLGMYERITAQQAKAAFTTALAELQPRLPVIDQKGEIKHGENKPVQSRYAKYEDINDAIRPLLHEAGFALAFRIHRTDAMVSVTGVLSHREGHSEETTIDLPADGSGSKNAVQAVGSSITYGKRYAAIALLNITSRAPQDRDDNGERGGADHWITDDQVADLVALMDEVGADRTRFLNHLRIDTLARLPASRFADAVKALENKRKAR
jgi:hypothetical protein